MPYHNLPSITEADKFLKKEGLPSGKTVRSCVNLVLAEARQSIHSKSSDSSQKIEVSERPHILQHIADRVLKEQKKHAPLCRVINATGIVIHTNLGRAPLPEKALESLISKLSAYANVEFDLQKGVRGIRGDFVLECLKLLSGAEAALVVNNNAASVFLMLRALVSGKEVLVSRGELVEIGGSFRIPDIMKEAGATLIEVGCTNRTRLSDYAHAITENTVALLKVHPSNYVIQGFVEEVSASELAKLAQENQILSFYDLGSASFHRFKNPALQHLLTVQQEVAQGMDLLCFSADKLLGSTQAGILLGKKELIASLKKHPLYRSLRPDKTTLCLLEATLESYRNPATLSDQIPVIQLLEQSSEYIQQRVSQFLEKITKSKIRANFDLSPTISLAGGGALPELSLKSWGILIKHPQHSAQTLCNMLRTQTPAILGRIHKNEFFLDFRSILEEEEQRLMQSLLMALR